MKKLTILIALTLGLCRANAQTDSVKVEQFCQVVAIPRLLSNRVTIDIDLGEEKKFWKDTRLRDWGGKVKKFTTIVDAMNFMGREGWSFINAYPVKTGDTETFHFAFKKLFYKFELQ